MSNDFTTFLEESHPCFHIGGVPIWNMDFETMYCTFPRGDFPFYRSMLMHDPFHHVGKRPAIQGYVPSVKITKLPNGHFEREYVVPTTQHACYVHRASRLFVVESSDDLQRFVRDAFEACHDHRLNPQEIQMFKRFFNRFMHRPDNAAFQDPWEDGRINQEFFDFVNAVGIIQHFPCFGIGRTVFETHNRFRAFMRDESGNMRQVKYLNPSAKRGHRLKLTI